MTPQEKALELYNNFEQYYWDDEIGYMPDEKKTKKMAMKVIDEIETQAKNWGVISVTGYWKEVRAKLKEI